MEFGYKGINNGLSVLRSPVIINTTIPHCQQWSYRVGIVSSALLVAILTEEGIPVVLDWK